MKVQKLASAETSKWEPGELVVGWVGGDEGVSGMKRCSWLGGVSCSMGSGEGGDGVRWAKNAGDVVCAVVYAVVLSASPA